MKKITLYLFFLIIWRGVIAQNQIHIKGDLEMTFNNMNQLLIYRYLMHQNVPDSMCEDRLRLNVWFTPRPKTDTTIYSVDIFARNNITVNLEAPLSIESIYQWQIVDVTGKKLKSGTFNNNLETISTQDLNTGIYMFRIVNDKEAIIKVEKFTIIK